MYVSPHTSHSCTQLTQTHTSPQKNGNLILDNFFNLQCELSQLHHQQLANIHTSLWTTHAHPTPLCHCTTHHTVHITTLPPTSPHTTPHYCLTTMKSWYRAILSKGFTR